MTLQELLPILQMAIGPVILISGIGVLLLSMTNLFGRVTDRSRQLLLELSSAEDAEQELILAQVQSLARRALLVKRAINLVALSVLFAAILVITLFLAAIFRWEAGMVLIFLFICCLTALIAALVAFLLDINLSLTALRLELARKLAGPRRNPL